MSPTVNNQTAAGMRAHRLKHKASLRKTATAMGFSAAYLCDLEFGRRRWTDDLCARLKAAAEKVGAYT